MRLILFTSVLTVLSIPSVANAWAYKVVGSEPQSEANYSQFVGLIDVVNLPSRRQLYWCNGAETFSYAGDTDALNVTLQLFTKIKCPTHTVVLRPGRFNGEFDWQLHIVQGIARSGIKEWNMEAVKDLDPVLVVYVSDNIDLDSVIFPAGVQVQQLSDLRARYVRAQQTGSDYTQRAAVRYLKALDQDPALKRLGKNKYEASISQIDAFIQRLATKQ